MKKETFSISGMDCASCALTIEKALSKVKGVSKAVVNFAAEKTTIEYQKSDIKNQKKFYDQLKEAVKEVGYELVIAHLRGVSPRSVEGPLHLGGAKDTEILKLRVVGMKSGHCAMIVEQAVKTLPGIKSITVDFANSKAKIVYETNKTTPEAIQKVITEAGYKPIADDQASPSLVEGKKEELEDKEKVEREHELRILKKKLTVGVTLSALITIISFWDSFTFLPQISKSIRYFTLFILTIPVQFWVGAQFYRGLILLAKYKTADMNTLIATGTLAAFFYSTAVMIANLIWNIFYPSCPRIEGVICAQGYPAWLETIRPLVERSDIYFDTAAIIITLILLGRFIEARAKGQASEAIKKLMGLQPNEATVLLKEGDERIKVISNL